MSINLDKHALEEKINQISLDSETVLSDFELQRQAYEAQIC